MTGLEHTPSPAHEPCRSVPPLFTCVTLTGSARFRSSSQCCLPNISSVTINHAEFFELPSVRGGGYEREFDHALRRLPSQPSSECAQKVRTDKCVASALAEVMRGFELCQSIRNQRNCRNLSMPIELRLGVNGVSMRAIVVYFGEAPEFS